MAESSSQPIRGYEVEQRGVSCRDHEHDPHDGGRYGGEEADERQRSVADEPNEQRRATREQADHPA